MVDVTRRALDKVTAELGADSKRGTMAARIGLIVNPTAGWAAGWACTAPTGERYAEAVSPAPSRPARRGPAGPCPLAPRLGGRGRRRHTTVTVLAPAGPMGGARPDELGLAVSAAARLDPAATTAADTRVRPPAMAEPGVDLLVFAGGDGTAREIMRPGRGKVGSPRHRGRHTGRGQDALQCLRHQPGGRCRHGQRLPGRPDRVGRREAEMVDRPRCSARAADHDEPVPLSGRPQRASPAAPARRLERAPAELAALGRQSPPRCSPAACTCSARATTAGVVRQALGVGASRWASTRSWTASSSGPTSEQAITALAGRPPGRHPGAGRHRRPGFPVRPGQSAALAGGARPARRREPDYHRDRWQAVGAQPAAATDRLGDDAPVRSCGLPPGPHRPRAAAS